jgi:hypothetical protein
MSDQLILIFRINNSYPCLHEIDLTILIIDDYTTELDICIYIRVLVQISYMIKVLHVAKNL